MVERHELLSLSNLSCPQTCCWCIIRHCIADSVRVGFGVYACSGHRAVNNGPSDKRNSRQDHQSVLCQADESVIGCVLRRSMMMNCCGNTQHRDSKVRTWTRGNVDVVRSFQFSNRSVTRC